MDQIEIAWRLARHFCHTWGGLELQAVREAYSIGGLEGIALRAAREIPEGPAGPGITGPVWRGVFHIHRTATYRTFWAVAPDGSVVFEITRPEPEGSVLLGWADPSQGVAHIRPTWRCAHFFQRHLDAACRVLRALGIRPEHVEGLGIVEAAMAPDPDPEPDSDVDDCEITEVSA